METSFERNSFKKRLKSMLIVDMRRMCTMPLFYIMAGISFVVPILILVMTTMMDGSISVDPTTGVETIMQGFESIWPLIGMSNNSSAGIDIMSMCNINLLYFALAVFVSLFVSADFKSGYAKNLFTGRAKKNDYVISKMITCFIAGTLMFLVFFLGTILGGAIAGVSFALGSLTGMNVVCCLLSKVVMVAVFVPIYLATSIAAKHKTWKALVGAFVVGMLIFPMIPSLTPLAATWTNVGFGVVGALFTGVLGGCISTWKLEKKDIL